MLIHERTKSCTCHFTSAAVHAELEILAMEMIRDRIQTIREFFVIQLQLPLLVSTFRVLPAVIQHNIVVAEISQSEA
jgi:hypothetical protein